MTVVSTPQGLDGSARQSAFSAQSDDDLENDTDEDEVAFLNSEAETEYNGARGEPLFCAVL